MSVEIDSTDVIRIIEQYLKENNLIRTLTTLQEESLVSLNAVDSIDDFVSNIEHGNWDMVLHSLSSLNLLDGKLTDLYEQVFFELLEHKELGLAKSFLRQSSPFHYIMEKAPERYMKLENLLSVPSFNPDEVYSIHSSKEKRRAEIANNLSKCVSVPQPSRLLTLLGQAIQWQKHTGILPLQAKSVDLFKSSSIINETSQVDFIASVCYATIKFERDFRPEVAVFSPDGQYFVTGTIDGFIEVWDYKTGKLRKDLPYQSEEGEHMAIDGAVFCLGFNKNNDLFALGSESGDIYIWSIRDGQCVKRIHHAHQQGVSHIRFLRDSNSILSIGYDKIIKIFGLKSGHVIKEFRGHTAFVNHAVYSLDGSKLLSACSDGTIKIWDVKAADCIMTISPRQDIDQIGSSLAHIPIYSLHSVPKRDEYIVCCKSTVIPIVSIHGMTVNVLKSESKSDFVAGTLSAHGMYYYTISEDLFIHCFEVSSGKFIDKYKVADEEVVGLTHHPTNNILATYSVDGLLKFWSSS